MTGTELDDMARRFDKIKNGAPFVLSTHRFNCLTADHEVSLVGTCDRAATLVDDARLLNELVAILQSYSGEGGEGEGAVDTLRRLIQERNKYRDAHEQLRRAVLAEAAPKTLAAPFDITQASVSEVNRERLAAGPLPMSADQIAEHIVLVAGEGFPADPSREDTWHISDSDLRDWILQAVEMAREYPTPTEEPAG